MKQKVFFVVFLLICIFSIYLIAHISRKNYQSQASISTQKNSHIKIGLCTGLGGLGDKSFNDMQYNGLIQVRK